MNFSSLMITYYAHEQTLFLLLAALLVATVMGAIADRVMGSASFGTFGNSALIAMAIASVKASLVIAFFMHLKWDTAINKIVFLSSFLFLSLLFIFTLADQFTRRLDHELHTTSSPVDNGWVQPPKRVGNH